MFITRIVNKKCNIVYVVVTINYWNSDVQESRPHNTCIGRIDPETGKLVATNGRMIKPEAYKNLLKHSGLTENDLSLQVKELLVLKGLLTKNDVFDLKAILTPNEKVSENKVKPQNDVWLDYGTTYFLDEIGKQIGLNEDLETCFPNSHLEIRSIIDFLIMEPQNALRRFNNWARRHKHPCGTNISSQLSSKIFAGITQEEMNHFFKLRGKHCSETEFLLYDTTSISSFSESIKIVKYGLNKEDDDLPQLNLAVVYGEQSGLPIYIKILPGNIPDVKTINCILNDLKRFGFKTIKFVMDKGFFSIDNINDFLVDNHKFLISSKLSFGIVKNIIDNLKDDFMSAKNYNLKHDLYFTTVPVSWAYTQKNGKKGKRNVYVYLYYSSTKAIEKITRLNKRLLENQLNLSLGKLNYNLSNFCKKYLIEKKNSKGEAIYVINEEAVKAEKQYYGYTAYISNVKMEAISARELYNNKDKIEKVFHDLKTRLNCRRTKVSSEESLEGKVFVMFVALIYLSYIRKQMSAENLFHKYTVTDLLDTLDSIQCKEAQGKKLRINIILNEQKEIFKKFKIKIPT